jgi:hypothetical protein
MHKKIPTAIRSGHNPLHEMLILEETYYLIRVNKGCIKVKVKVKGKVVPVLN